MSVTDATLLIENTTNLFILDVRTLDEYNAGHIEKAYLIPYDQIESRASELPENKSTPILVYCRSGTRSAIASSTLVNLGYTEIFNLEKGFNDWKDQNNKNTSFSLYFIIPFFILSLILIWKRNKLNSS